MDSEERFNKLKDNRINFSYAQKRQGKFLKKLNEAKIGRKNYKQEEMIDNLNKFYLFRENS